MYLNQKLKFKSYIMKNKILDIQTTKNKQRKKSKKN